MYAVIATGGKQYRVSEGDVVFVEKLAGDIDDEVVFSDVLTVVQDGDVKIGAPYLEGAKVTAKVVKQGKEKKILVYKYKSKANYRRKQGHRQPYTKVSIEKIEA
jgi:large subunit ribosomal protein L21